MSSSYHMKKKLSNQVVPISYTLEKMFFGVATLEGLRIASSDRRKSLYSIHCLVRVFFGFSGKRKRDKHCL